MNQFSPFITIPMGRHDASYDDYASTAQDVFPVATTTVRSNNDATTNASTESARQIPSPAQDDGVFNTGLDLTAKHGEITNNTESLPNEDNLSQPSPHEIHSTGNKSDSSTSEASSDVNQTSRAASPSQSSASSVADEFPLEGPVAKEEVSSIRYIASDEIHCQPEMDAPPPPPPSSTETTSSSDHMYSIFTQNNTSLLSETIISAPAYYVASTPGKKIRDKAASALNIWLQVPEDDLQQIRRVIDMLHNASLILDDVEDGSVSRRGRPATHMIFGVPQAINSAGYQINRAMMEALKLGSVECLDIFIEELDRLYIGQGYDLFWTFNIKRPSVEKYISMVDYKTGSLFNMLVRFMAAKTGTDKAPHPDLTRLVVLLGRYFQIRDDYMNLTSDEYTLQKGYCDDLDEGKFSLTLVHALENSPEAERSILRHLLAQRASSDCGMSLAQKHLIIDIVRAAGSLEYTLTALREIGREIEAELGRVEQVTGMENRPLRGLVEVLRV
ncbi:Geranylgeranyl diphosphate synthase sdnC [Rhypophila sp. PSN 637]